MRRILVLFCLFTLCSAQGGLSASEQAGQVQEVRELQTQSQEVQTQEVRSAQNFTPSAGQPQTTQNERKELLDLSFKALFLNAHIVVKGVIAVLFAFSVLTWSVFFAKLIELKAANARLKRDEKLLENSSLLALCGVVGKSFCKLFAEQIQDELSKTKTTTKAVKARVKERLQITALEATNRVKSRVSILASVSSSAPFVGLFGTVWGIMNSFIAIANSNSASLSVVAPGIAEALFATALGLVAAIPATLLYNYLVRATMQFGSRLDLMATRVYLIFDREFEKNES